MVEGGRAVLLGAVPYNSCTKNGTINSGQSCASTRKRSVAIAISSIWYEWILKVNITVIWRLIIMARVTQYNRSLKKDYR